MGLHIFLCHVVSDVEGSLHGTGIAFLADHAALLVLFILVKSLVRGYGQIPVFQSQFHLVLLESGQIHIDFIPVFLFTDVCLHFTLCIASIETAVHVLHLAVKIIKPVIKQTLTKNTRHQHTSYFLSIVEPRRFSACSCMMMRWASGQRVSAPGVQLIESQIRGGNHPSMQMVFFSGTFLASFLGRFRWRTPSSKWAFTSSSVMFWPT